MFDDNQKQPNNPPKNLPLSDEADDMFAGIDESTPSAEASELPQTRIGSKSNIDHLQGDLGEGESSLPNALEAGKLTPKKDAQSGIFSASTANPTAEFNPNPKEENIDFPKQQVYAMKEPVVGKVLLLVVFLFALIGLVFGGIWFYNNYMGNPEQNTDLTNNEPSLLTDDLIQGGDDTLLEDNINEGTNIEKNLNGDLTEEINNDIILFGEPVDSDGDGLDDVREMELGTDPNLYDTDDDGLSDADEVLIWKTDPNNLDSDDDSYDDGTEIRSGYNPLGPGKIFEDTVSTPTTTEDITTTI